jgi:hypothetical protein
MHILHGVATLLLRRCCIRPGGPNSDEIPSLRVRVADDIRLGMSGAFHDDVTWLNQSSHGGADVTSRFTCANHGTKITTSIPCDANGYCSFSSSPAECFHYSGRQLLRNLLLGQRESIFMRTNHSASFPMKRMDNQATAFLLAHAHTSMVL